jgi:hypothetical protein
MVNSFDDSWSTQDDLKIGFHVRNWQTQEYISTIKSGSMSAVSGRSGPALSAEIGAITVTRD